MSSDVTNRIYEPYIQSVAKLKTFFIETDGTPIPQPKALSEIESAGIVEVVTNEPAIQAAISSVDSGNLPLTRISNLVSEERRDAEIYKETKKEYEKEVKNSSNPSESSAKRKGSPKLESKPIKKKKKIKSQQDIFTL